ncbi:MAG: type II toxin-antitoxin system HicB family antitoxin [Proteobacteria bacterium]|nr:type II toxin-antitoxin system HicB family antitoxin [Pseudomonadota bacterium]
MDCNSHIIFIYDYEIIIRPLSPEDGGGFVAIVPDLKGCISDGETRAEAASNIEDAIDAWIKVQVSMGREVPLASKSAHAA